MKKKIISCVLGMSMMASLLTGCAKEGMEAQSGERIESVYEMEIETDTVDEEVQEKQVETEDETLF